MEQTERNQKVSSEQRLHWDPRNASRTPSAKKMPHLKFRYDTPINACEWEDYKSSFTILLKLLHGIWIDRSHGYSGKVGNQKRPLRPFPVGICHRVGLAQLMEAERQPCQMVMDTMLRVGLILQLAHIILTVNFTQCFCSKKIIFRFSGFVHNSSSWRRACLFAHFIARYVKTSENISFGTIANNKQTIAWRCKHEWEPSMPNYLIGWSPTFGTAFESRWIRKMLLDGPNWIL